MPGCTQPGSARKMGRRPFEDSVCVAIEDVGDDVEDVGDDVEALPRAAGATWYADVAQADDSGDGKTPDTAKKTFVATTGLAQAGDKIRVKQGTYDEVGMALTLAGLELLPEIGVLLQDTAGGTVLTVSGATCRVKGDIRIIPTGAIGMLVSGAASIVEGPRIFNATTAFSITGSGVQLRNVGAALPTVTAFHFAASQITVDGARTAGVNGATRGYWITNSADFIRLNQCESTGHGTAGFQIDADSTECMIRDCASGAGDGDRIDNGIDNMWANFTDRMRRERHEHAYPFSDGEGAAGAAVIVTNSTTDDAAGQRDDQDYWGDPHIIIPPDLLAGIWSSVGLYIHAVTTQDDQQWEIFFPQPQFCSDQNGGNDWDIDETVLTVVDGDIFAVNDLVWMAGNDRPAGEILKVTDVTGNVVTIVSETRMGGGVGVRYDYDVDPSVNQLCVVRRSGVRVLHGYNGSYSAASAKDSLRYNWDKTKRVDTNGGMIMRLLNGTDAAATSIEVRAIYED